MLLFVYGTAAALVSCKHCAYLDLPRLDIKIETVLLLLVLGKWRRRGRAGNLAHAPLPLPSQTAKQYACSGEKVYGNDLNARANGHIITVHRCELVFFVSTWDEYHTKELHLALVNGPDDGLVVMTLTYFIAAFLPPNTLKMWTLGPFTVGEWYALLVMHGLGTQARKQCSGRSRTSCRRLGLLGISQAHAYASLLAGCKRPHLLRCTYVTTHTRYTYHNYRAGELCLWRSVLP